MTRIPLILSLLALLPASALAQSTWYVPDDFSTIQLGIDGATNGDTVIVRDGTYYENINFNGMAITLKSENGPATAIIDGNQAGSVVIFNNREGIDSVFEGFTVTNGMADYGGGLYCRLSSPTLTNCMFTNNTATQRGGGMNCDVYASPALENCTFTGNTATYSGGGMYGYYSSSTLTNCTFTDNTAKWGGGIHFNALASPTLENCTFTNNTATTYGGGIYSQGGFPALENCTFTNNSAQTGGGILWHDYSSSTLENCTFTNNTATNGGGGIYCHWSASLTLTNCILWGNSSQLNGVGIAVSYSNIEGSFSGTGNIDADSLFVDSDNGDFHLQAGSPCIDTGDPNSSLDPDGTRADMGAFYFDQSTPTLSVTNLVAGQAALVEVTNATPNNFSHFAWSVHGGGPITTPWGNAMVTPPYNVTLLPTDSTGYASYTANIPLHAAGVTVWCHGTDVGTQSMLNALMLVIQ